MRERLPSNEIVNCGPGITSVVIIPAWAFYDILRMSRYVPCNNEINVDDPVQESETLERVIILFRHHSKGKNSDGYGIYSLSKTAQQRSFTFMSEKIIYDFSYSRKCGELQAFSEKRGDL
jgi:hypothetical protein